MKSEVEWPIAFFDDDYLRIYRPMFTEERTRAEVEFIRDALDLPSGSHVLDLACGIGRHAVGMAQLGFRITGLDFSAPYLEIAAQAAGEAGVALRCVRGDMRALDFNAEFEGVYSYFTSFGYFSDPENEDVIARVARALKPGGRFLIDVTNRDRILTQPQHRTWEQREDGALVMEENSLELKTSRAIQRKILMDPKGGAQVVKEFNLRVYTCGELTAMLARHGLEAQSTWGGIDRSEYAIESRRLIVLATRTDS